MEIQSLINPSLQKMINTSTMSNRLEKLDTKSMVRTAGKNMTKAQKEKLKNSTEQFEALFLMEVFKAMDKTTMKTGWIDGGHGEKIFNESLMYERAKEASRGSNLGLGSLLYKQLTGESYKNYKG